MVKTISDEFREYIVSLGRTKLTIDEVFEEFKTQGFYKRCKDNAFGECTNWNDEAWKAYIYYYLKFEFGIEKSKGIMDHVKILS